MTTTKPKELPEPDDMTTEAIISELKRCNPFGGYTKAQGRDSLIRTLRRYRSS